VTASTYGDADRFDDLFSMWSIAVDAPDDSASRLSFQKQPQVAALARRADRDLRRALYDARRALGGGIGRPDPGSWLQWVEAAEVAAGFGGQPDLTSLARVRAIGLIAERKLFVSQDAQHFPFTATVLEEALDRLGRRANEAVATSHLLKPRSPRWRSAPARNLVGAPVIDSDEVELAVVAILAATGDNWQFSSTPDGRMFVGTILGYHREGDRTYASGLSDVLDTAAGLVESHRAGAGGRIYITSRHVECAECKLVVAWINTVGSRSTAFGRCTSVKRRR
jgi:hypothetical protein